MTISRPWGPGRAGSDEEAEFRGFVDSFSPTLVRAAHLLLRDPDLAQDAVQTTLLRTFRRWRVARRAPEGYSRRVLVNVCRNHWRDARRRPPLTAEAGAAEPMDPTRGGERIEDRLMLEGALARLPELHREVIVARFFLELSVVEVAELLRVPEGTVKSATHRALAGLRELLADHPLEVHDAR